MKNVNIFGGQVSFFAKLDSFATFKSVFESAWSVYEEVLSVLGSIGKCQNNLRSSHDGTQKQLAICSYEGEDEWRLLRSSVWA